MKKMIPLEKQSKKNQRAHHNRKRGSWHGLNPVTRTVPSGKIYRREKLRSLREED